MEVKFLKLVTSEQLHYRSCYNMKLVKIKDNPSLVRDLSSNAILNTNRKELDEFNTARKKILADKKEKEETKYRLSKIEEDMLEIKQLLKEMAQLRSANGN